MAQSTPASAFLDFLFGSRQPASPAPSYTSRPLDVSVNPSKAADRYRFRKSQKDKAKNQHAKENGEKRPPGPNQVQRSIDPVAHPDWFLKDPNIRYGDILVLKSGPVIYQGSGGVRSRGREDFVSLARSSIVSRSSLRNVNMMVSGIWIAPEQTSTPAKKLRRARR